MAEHGDAVEIERIPARELGQVVERKEDVLGRATPAAARVAEAAILDVPGRDPVRRELMVFGGSTAATMLRDTWFLRDEESR